MNLVDGLGFKHLLVVFVASVAAGVLIVLIDGLVIVPLERTILSSQSIAAA